ncbi:MAG: glycosyltransferase family 4 protein [Kiritimatiellia bacterium]|jgi:glycosyltransferase involved in cell wall biosynthesis|nr:glycosyltransferase family 4 protein [Kiritimatiellia bacterium]
MKLLIVNYRYFLSGGPERYLFKVEELFRQHGDEVFILSARDPRNRPCPQEAYFVEGRGNDVYFNKIRLTPANAFKLLKGAFYNPAAARNLKRMIRDLRPDAVYVLQQNNLLSPAVFMAARQAGVRVVHRLSDYNLMCPRFDFLRNDAPCEKCLSGSLWNAVRYKCVQHSFSASLVRVLSMYFHRWIGAFDCVDAFIVTNHFMEKKLEEFGVSPERILLVSTFIDSAATAPRYEHQGYVLYLGRLEPEKGPQYAVAAMPHLADLNLRLKLTGTLADDPTGRLADLVQDHQLAEQVDFVGFVHGAELDNLIAGAMCILCPSVLYDNLPNVLLEAAAHGKPVIAPDHGCFPDVVEDGCTGLLFTPGSARDLAQKIRMLHTTPGLAETLGRNARAKCEREYTPARHYRDLCRVLQPESARPEPIETQTPLPVHGVTQKEPAGQGPPDSRGHT